MWGNIIRQLRETGQCYYYRRKYFELKKELDSLKEYVNKKIAEMEEQLNARLSVLEARLEELEEKGKKTELALKVIESLEPNKRVN